MPGQILDRTDARTYEIIAIASSAGGIGALETILSHLPREFSVPVVVLQHLDPNHRSRLRDILARHTTLLVEDATEGGKMEPGHVYIAPPNRHCLITSGLKVHLVDSKPIHF